MNIPSTLALCLESTIDISQGELQLKSVQKSPLGTHLTFQQYYDGFPIEKAFLKLHFDSLGNLIDKQAHLSFAKPKGNVFSKANVMVQIGGYLKYAYKKNSLTKTEILDSKGQTLFQNSNKLYLYNLPDTFGYLKVFLVNPVNSAGTSYGPPYVDNNDNYSKELENELTWKRINLTFEQDSFQLKNQFFRFEELNPPIQKAPKGIQDSFYFDRSNSNFEFINSYFHLNNFANYLTAIGFESLLDTISIDPRIEGDNSFYDFLNKKIQFGIGNVDDAEDGEVIVHEYSHALSTTASPNTTTGLERLAMEEGNADYLCKSYSRSFTGNVNKGKVFSWDGHNEFWPGFSIDSKKVYPNDMTSSSNNNREIWSTPLMKIWENLGKEKADRLILSHLFFQMPNATMPEMAKIILKLDTQFYGGQYSQTIWDIFASHGILPKISNIAKQSIQNIDPALINLQGFAFEQSALEIDFGKKIAFQSKIFSSDGKKVAEFFSSSGKQKIWPSFPPGLYILQLDFGQILFKKITIAR